mgnify:CR=1 FL=1
MMRSRRKVVMALIATAVLVASNVGMVFAAGLEATSGSGSAPVIDGSFDDWDENEIPLTYHYNWNKPAGENGYSTDTHHAMQLYSDGDYVYLNVTYAADYGSNVNSECYEFNVDGQTVRYQMTWPEGTVLTGSKPEEGVYEVDLRHGGGSCSWSFVDGASAYYKVNEGNVNNQLEFKIPLEEFAKQNGNIDLDNYSMIEMGNPNLMSGKISCAGSPTGSIPYAIAAFTLIPASCLLIKKKKK